MYLHVCRFKSRQCQDFKKILIYTGGVLALLCVLLEDVVDRLEEETLLPVDRDVPQLARLLEPVLLLNLVADVVEGLRPGIREDERKVPRQSKLLMHLGVDLPGEPSLVLAIVGVVRAALSSSNRLFAVGPETHPDHKIIPPLLTAELEKNTFKLL